MKISTMILIASAALLAGGVGKRTLAKNGIDLKHALFFVLCMLVMSAFTVIPSDESEAAAACVLLAGWLFGNAYNGLYDKRSNAMIIPLSMLSALALYPITNANALLGMASTAFLSSALTLLFGVPFGLAVSGCIPVFAAFVSYLISVMGSGYGTVELTEACFSCQLISSAGTILAGMMSASRSSQSKHVPQTAGDL